MKQHKSMLHVTLLAVTLVIAAATQALAQGAGDAKPWEQGVSDEQKVQARTLFAEGAELHRQSRYDEAVAKYKEAISNWDHPDIHFNLIQAYIEMKRPLDAHESLLQATRYGQDSLSRRDWARANEYRKLLEGQLGTIEIQCDEPGAKVTVNGELLFTGPGTKTTLIGTDVYTIVASKDGHVDDTRSEHVAAGETKQIVLKPMALADLAIANVSCDESDASVTMNGEPIATCPGKVEKYLTPGEEYVFTIASPERLTVQQSVTPKPGDRLDVVLATSLFEGPAKQRWSRWKPLAVVGAGAVVSIVGGVLQTRAVRNMNDYDRAIDSMCGAPINGCTPDMVPDDIHGKKDSATLQNRLGVSFLVIGSASVVTGLALVYLNRPRQEQPKPRGLSLAPFVSPGSVGVAADFSF